VNGGIPGCEDLVETGMDGEAVVLRAWQPAFQRHVAVHLHAGKPFEDLEALARKVAPLAAHPNVVTMHDMGVTAKGIPYYVTEVLELGTLAGQIERDGPLDWYDAASVTIKVAGVLTSAAAAGVPGLAVGPADVFRARFGEPKVALFRPLCGTEADTVRPFLRALLPTSLDQCPATVLDALADDSLDTAALARSLQRAQGDAGLPVTELPSGTPTAVVASVPLPEDFSGMVTIGPELTGEPSPRRRRRVALGAAALVLSGAVAGALVLRDGSQTPATTTISSPPSTPGGTGRAQQTLYDSAGFTGSEWQERTPGSLRSRVVGSEFHVSATGAWRASVWKPRGPRRVSVSVSARITSTGDGELSVYCGASMPGDKHLTGVVRNDGSWEITGNDQSLAAGSAPQRAHELRERFDLRFDCTTDTTPTRAVLVLNNVILGTSEGPGSFPLNAVNLIVGNKGAEPFELVINAVMIRTLD
jgi:hypothetical protein